MLYRFDVSVDDASLTETWEAELPDGLEGDALLDALDAQLSEGRARFIEQEAHNERGRNIVPDSIDALDGGRGTID